MNILEIVTDLCTLSSRVRGPFPIGNNYLVKISFSHQKFLFPTAKPVFFKTKSLYYVFKMKITRFKVHSK